MHFQHSKSKTRTRAIVIGLCVAAPCFFAFALLFLRSEHFIESKLHRIGARVESQVEPGNWPESCQFLNSTLGPFRMLARVWEVNVHSDYFSDADLRAICTPSLTGLSVGSAQITDHGVKALSDCPDLAYLALQCPQVTDGGLDSIPSTCPFREIAISSDEVSAEFLGRLRNRSKLKRLELHGKNIGDGVCRSIQRFENIEELILSRSSVTDDGLMLLDRLNRLKVLDVSETLVTEDGLQHFRSQAPNVRIRTSDSSNALGG